MPKVSRQWVKAGREPDEAAAKLAQGMLHSRGIRAVIEPEGEVGIIVYSPYLVPWRIMVPPEQGEEASRLLAQRPKPSPAPVRAPVTKLLSIISWIIALSILASILLNQL